MKAIQIHPLSAPFGAGIRSVTPLGSSQGPRFPVQITGQYSGYDPRNGVVIREEDGVHTVPAGKRESS